MTVIVVSTPYIVWLGNIPFCKWKRENNREMPALSIHSVSNILPLIGPRSGAFVINRILVGISSHVPLIASEFPAGRAKKERQKLTNSSPPKQHLFVNTETLYISAIMSVSAASGIMLKRTVLSSRLAAQPLNAMEVSTRSIRPATLGPYRAIHHSARLPAITPSETRHRPTLRPRHQPLAQTPSPVSKRTIFIQTENTPNPDVSSWAFHFIRFGSWRDWFTKLNRLFSVRR